MFAPWDRVKLIKTNSSLDGVEGMVIGIVDIDTYYMVLLEGLHEHPWPAIMMSKHCLEII